MRWPLPLLLALLIAGLVLPVLAAEGNRIGYVSFQEVSIRLTNGTATAEVNYSLDPGMDLVILLFGVGDLQKKLESSLNYPSLKAEEIGLSRAVFIVPGAAEDDGNGAYWFPAHSFGVTFPRVEVNAPGHSLTFTGVEAIPVEFGFFGDMP